MSNLCKKAPSTWPLFIAFVCLCFDGKHNAKIQLVTRNYLVDLIEKTIESDDSFSLIWTIYAAWRCDVILTSDLIAKTKELCGDNWLVMSLIDKKNAVFEFDGKEVCLVNTLKKESIYKVISVFGYPVKFR